VTKRTIEDLLQEHPFTARLTPDQLALVAGCGKNIRYDAGAFLAREGCPADEFFVIRQGRVAVSASVPGRGDIVLETLREGDVAGWSWIMPPYLWTFNIQALEPVLAIALDGKCLRQKCETDTHLGFAIMRALAEIMTVRLRATRLQLVDMYGAPPL